MPRSTRQARACRPLLAALTAHLAGTLDLPWAYDASQLLLAGLHLATARFGVRFWSQPLELLGGQSIIAYAPAFMTLGSVVTVVTGSVPRGCSATNVLNAAASSGSLCFAVAAPHSA